MGQKAPRCHLPPFNLLLCQVGDVILARWSDDNVIYRASVIAISEEGADVRFLDYGNKDIVAFDAIRPIPQELAAFPMQVRILSFQF